MDEYIEKKFAEYKANGELEDDFEFILANYNRNMDSNKLKTIFNLHNKYLPSDRHQHATYCSSCRANVKRMLDVLIKKYDKFIADGTTG